MIQLTAARVGDPRLFDPPLVVAAAAHADAIEAQLGRDTRLFLEPCQRNTAPAVALAALCVPPETLLLVMPSDHLMSAPEQFLAAVEEARPLAEEGWLVTFGVRPTRAETGFGYIRRGAPLAPGLFAVAQFVEKPDAARASRFVADGTYDWNAGIFFFTAGAFLAALEEHAGDILDATRSALPHPLQEAGPVRPATEMFEKVRSQSVDRAVMELARNVAVAPIDAGWSDLGSWEALHSLGRSDAQGNDVSGPVELLGVTNCLVRSEGPQVVAIGVHDLAIVATDDAVLIVPLNQSQRVSEAVASLAKSASGLV